MVKNKANDKEQYNRCSTRLGTKNVGTFVNFQKMKYNSIEWNESKHQYSLKGHYDKVIDNGNLDPLIDFKLYSDMDKNISDNLHGIEVNNVKINTHSYHFIDRVFGSVEQKRNGVGIEEIKNTLTTSKRFKTLEKSIKIYGVKNIVSVNPQAGNLIQVNPFQ
ncbi:MAG: hypothetical protein RSE00_00805 [Clostridia bacterium]